MTRLVTRRAMLIAAFAATVPAVTAIIVILDLDPASREGLIEAARAEWWVLLLGLVTLVGGVWWIMRGGLHAHDQAARRLAAAARTAANAPSGDPAHQPGAAAAADGRP